MKPGHGRKPRRGPLPDVADHLLDAVRRRAGRVGADRGGTEGVAAEVGQGRRPVRVAPRPPAPAAEVGIPRARLLPLLLGGEPRAGPGGVGLGLVEADVLHRLVGRDLLDVAEPAPRAVGGPEQRPLEAGVEPVLPARRRPPPRLVVAAGVDEPLPLAVGDRHPRDAEGGQVDDVCRTLVVERPGLGVAVDAQHELPGRHQHGVGRQQPARRQRRPRAEQRLAVAELVGGEHGLDVLLLVLLDHDVGEQALPVGAREPVEHPAADVGDEGAGLAGRQQRQAHA